MKPSLVRYSKFLSLVLRHKPEKIGLQLDENGWADVGELIEKSNRAGVALTRAKIEEIVHTNEKKRFALGADGRRIRARQGHSIPVDLGLRPVEPPAVLYHGTARRNLESIRTHGLRRKGRHHVHLSPDYGSALKVGARHGKPVVFEVLAGEMNRRGYEFFVSENGVWLVKYVPQEFLRLAKTDEC